MGRTLPPLFRTVRRVVRILLTRTPRRFLRRVWQISAKGWTSAEFCKSPKADVSAEFCENVLFVWQISAEQSCGAGSGSHLGYIPPFRLRISFDVLLLACKGSCLALILLLRVCRVKRADVAIISPYSTLQSLYIFSPSKKPCISTVFAFCRGQFSSGKWTVFLKESGQNS